MTEVDVDVANLQTPLSQGVPWEFGTQRIGAEIETGKREATEPWQIAVFVALPLL